MVAFSDGDEIAPLMLNLLGISKQKKRKAEAVVTEDGGSVELHRLAEQGDPEAANMCFFQSSDNSDPPLPLLGLSNIPLSRDPAQSLAEGIYAREALHGEPQAQRTLNNRIDTLTLSQAATVSATVSDETPISSTATTRSPRLVRCSTQAQVAVIHLCAILKSIVARLV